MAKTLSRTAARKSKASKPATPRQNPKTTAFDAAHSAKLLELRRVPLFRLLERVEREARFANRAVRSDFSTATKIAARIPRRYRRRWPDAFLCRCLASDTHGINCFAPAASWKSPAGVMRRLYGDATAQADGAGSEAIDELRAAHVALLESAIAAASKGERQIDTAPVARAMRSDGIRTGRVAASGG